MAAGAAKELTFSGDFSPGIISDIGKLLKTASDNGGDKAKLIDAIRDEYFRDTAAGLSNPDARRKQQDTRAYNVILSLMAYGLLDRESYTLTPVGLELLSATSPEGRAEAFAKHILFKCNGMVVLDAVRHLERQGKQPTKNNLLDTLRKVFGYDIPRASTRHTAILNWLAQAGVCGRAKERYRINEDRLEKLTGLKQADRDDWHTLSRDLRSFALSLRHLAMTHGEELLPARDVYDYAMNRYGLETPEDQFAYRLFDPLEMGGWLTRPGRGAGRGGKSGLLKPTEKLLSSAIDIVSQEPEPNIPPDLMRHIQEPLAKIHKGLRSQAKHVKGIALELLALRMVMDLGLTPTGFRLRSGDTGGAEVDLTAEGAHLLFSRWTFQCKNTKKVPLSELAKEIGMATMLKAHVVVMVATGSFASTVIDFAHQVAQTTPLQVVLVAGNVVDRYLESGEKSIGLLMEFFRTAAAETMRLKEPQRTEAQAEVVAASSDDQ